MTKKKHYPIFFNFILHYNNHQKIKINYLYYKYYIEWFKKKLRKLYIKFTIK